MANFINLIGHVYGRLTVEERSQDKNKNIMWLCVCECGNKTICQGRNLKSGHTKSCGCLNKEAITKHGMGKSTEYTSWAKMKGRCLNQNNSRYKNYGGRGIIVCESWIDSFDNFLSDMGSKPTPEHSIDRINNDGDYEPGNCRWANVKTQSRNTTRSRRITFNGVTKCISEWAEFKGINLNTLYARIHRYKWSPERALTTPAGS